MAKLPHQYRPSFKRQMTYAGSLLAAIVVAYLLTTLIIGDPEQKAEPVRMSKEFSAPVKPKAWYQTQSPPPTMILTPDPPLFPEVPDQEKALPYEEALPKETYVPAVPETMPDPVAAPAQVPEPQIAAIPMPKLPHLQQLPRWRQFAVATPLIGGKPMISIVIDDMGVDKKRSAMAIDLPGPLTLSFLTYATKIKSQTEKARSRGHELMLHVSMEPGSKAVDPGPNALLTSLSDEELRRRLRLDFARFPTYVGVNNHMGSKFTSNRKAMSVVIEEIKKRGLLFLDSRTSGSSVGAAVAREMGVPVAERNIFIDHENNIDAVHAQLRKVEQLARRTGAVIAIGHPRDVTIRALREWLAGIEAKGFQLVPLTTLVMLNTKP